MGSEIFHNPNLTRFAFPGAVCFCFNLWLPTSITLKAGIGNLLEQLDFICDAPWGLERPQQGVEIAIARGRWFTITLDQQRSGHATANLHRRGAMGMGVIPKCAGRMVDRHIVFVFKIYSWLYS